MKRDRDSTGSNGASPPRENGASSPRGGSSARRPEDTFVCPRLREEGSALRTPTEYEQARFEEIVQAVLPRNNLHLYRGTLFEFFVEWARWIVTGILRTNLEVKVDFLIQRGQARAQRPGANHRVAAIHKFVQTDNCCR